METKGKTVLYVDDEAVNLQLFDAHFNKYFKVLTSISPLDGINIIENQPVDILITDFKMPGMNGIDFIKEVKKKHPGMKCLVISGYIDACVMLEGNQRLVHRYFLKPWTKEVILEELFSILA
ncbi:MAG: response regulator [Bacteroidales bacterium]